MEITRAGIMINQPSNSMSNNIGVFHTPNESLAPPVAFISASGITITGSALSAFSPPRAILINQTSPNSYKLYPFHSNIPGALTSITIYNEFSTYYQGSFNRITLANGNELPTLSSAYFVW